MILTVWDVIWTSGVLKCPHVILNVQPRLRSTGLRGEKINQQGMTRKGFNMWYSGTTGDPVGPGLEGSGRLFRGDS